MRFINFIIALVIGLSFLGCTGQAVSEWKQDTDGWYKQDSIQVSGGSSKTLYTVEPNLVLDFNPVEGKTYNYTLYVTNNSNKTIIADIAILENNKIIKEHSLKLLPYKKDSTSGKMVFDEKKDRLFFTDVQRITISIIQ